MKNLTPLNSWEGSNEKDPLILPVSPEATATHLQTQSRAALGLTLLPLGPGLSAATSDCSARQGGDVPQPRSNEFISPHHSVIVRLSLQIHTAVVPGPKHSLPAEIPYSLQSPALQQVWALHGEQRTTSPIHQLALHEVHSHHSKYNPGIFFIVQSSSFLIHRNETNGILFFLILILKDWEPLNKRWLWNMPALLESERRDTKFRN